MASIRERFTNIIACEDVRDEVGNKKSLMGVFSGDILVSEFPATIHMAFYLDYIQKETSPGDNVQLELKANNERMVRVEVQLNTGQPINSIILPRAVVVFEKECVLTMQASISGGKQVEIMRKKIQKGLTPPR